MNKHQVEVLSNLRPETVVAVEGVPFTIRGLALPGVEEALESLSEVAFVGASDRDEAIDVKAECRIQPDTEERMVVMERFIVAGGLCVDDDTEHCNPLAENHANGHLYHRGRRAWGDEEACFFDALGRDGYGNKDLDDDSVSGQLADGAVASIRKNRSLMTTLSNLLRSRGKVATWDAVLKTITDAVHEEGWEFALDYIARWFLDASWWSDLAPCWHDKLGDLDRLLCENEAEAAWERAHVAGSIGNPLAVLLDIYEHGGVVYSVTGHGMQCRWDTTRGGAIWVPDQDAEDNIRSHVLRGLGVGDVHWSDAAGSRGEPPAVRCSLDGGATWVGGYATRAHAMAAMVEVSGLNIPPSDLAAKLAEESERYCRGVLDEYNAWVNGEVYGVVVYVVDRTSGRRVEARDDECWGYIGSEYAEESLEDAVLATVMHLGEPAH